MNLPALQRIAMEFEKENDIMDQRQEMMDDAIDDATGMEDEEESEDVVNQVLDEIGIDLGQSVSISRHYEGRLLMMNSLERHQVDSRRLLCLRAG
jgi:division protein CdvB (Snf7/Vps24/ESCRT-III family)